VRRKAQDAHDAAMSHTVEHGWHFAQWLGSALVAARSANLGATRSVPRGEHRGELGSSYDLPDDAPLDVVISSRGWSAWNFIVHKMPRWRRGELRLAEQRRAKHPQAPAESHLQAATRLLQEWLDGYTRSGVRPQVTPTWLADAQNFVDTHHPEPGAVEIRLDAEARAIVVTGTVALPGGVVRLD